MDMQDGLVACAEKGFVLKEIQEVQLGVKVCDSWYWQMPTAEDKAWGNFIFVNATQPQAQVFTALCCLDFIVISVDGCDCYRNPADMQYLSPLYAAPYMLQSCAKRGNAGNAESYQSGGSSHLLIMTAQCQHAMWLYSAMLA